MRFTKVGKIKIHYKNKGAKNMYKKLFKHLKLNWILTKCSFKRNILNLFLKISNEVQFLNSMGIEFHNIGA